MFIIIFLVVVFRFCETSFFVVVVVVVVVVVLLLFFRNQDFIPLDPMTCSDTRPLVKNLQTFTIP
jgi:hypothetical protein